MSATEQATATATAAVDDANDLRGFHFRRLLRRKLTWALVLGFALAAGIAGAIAVGVAIGSGAALVVFLLALLIVFGIADSRSEDAFFEAYAQSHGMTLLDGRGRLPQATPLLRKGDDRYTERSLLGSLGDGFEGTLALYTYEDETTDGEGNRETNYYRYTVGLAEVPECAGGVPELYCQRKFGLHALEKFEDVFRGSKERVKLESTALEEKYEIFAVSGQDANLLRQLFSPTFIVWLTDSAPPKFAFELVGGTLCCYVSGHKKKTAELEAIAAATGAVAARLRDESRE